jgi:hypothetical protein
MIVNNDSHNSCTSGLLDYTWLQEQMLRRTASGQKASELFQRYIRTNSPGAYPFCEVDFILMYKLTPHTSRGYTTEALEAL